MGGTTTLDIGNDINIIGGVLNTDNIQGAISGDVNIESLQDSASYDSKQKNIGFTADIDLKGAGSRLSVNGGKTDINADYKAVDQQLGLFTGDGGFDPTVDGKTTLIGGAITTTDAAVAAGRNKYVSKGGITTQDIVNISGYEGDAIQVGVSLGMTDRKPQGNTNGLGYGTDSDSDGSITKAGITGIAGNSGITTDNQAEYAGALENVFDETRVNEELGAQVEITQAFDQERRKIKTEINKKEQDLRAESEAAFNNGDFHLAKDKLIAADKVQNQGLLFDAISGAVYGPNTNGVTGYVAKAASPFVSNQIGQYYKELADNQDGNLTGAQQTGHILAHGILGAAVSYATGNDTLTGGLSASTGEASAPILSNFLYGTSDPSKLTAEQKDTISSITSALGAGIGATTGNVTDTVNAAETNKVAVENNNLKNKDVESLLYKIAVAKRRYTGGKLDTELREIRSLAAKMAEDNFKEIKSCQDNPTEACLNQLRVDYSNVNFEELENVYRLYPGTQTTLDGYKQNNNSVVSCSTSRPADCIYIDGGLRVINGAVYEALGAGALRKVPTGTTAQKAVKETVQESAPKNLDFSKVCSGTVCFTAGTLVHTIHGLKPIETIEYGELVWSREEFGDKYDYRPVIATKVTPNAPIYEVKIKHDSGLEETFSTTEEHPFWIDGEGWRKASILKSGMKLLDKYGNVTATVISQTQLEETDTVYNFEVQDFHTYHIGEMGIWVHNADCCDFTNNWGSIEPKFKAAGWVDSKTNKVRYLDPFDGKLKNFPDDVTPSVDHVLPRAEAKKIAGNKLTTAELNEIVNAPDNLMPLPKHLNSSKGKKVEYENGGWIEYGNKGKPVPISPAYKESIGRIQLRIQEKIRKAVEAKEGK